MKKVILACMALLALVISSCGSKASKADFPGTDEGAKQLTGELLKGNSSFLPSLRPTDADIEALFDASVVAPMKAYVAKTYAEISKAKIGGKDGQTELLFKIAKSEDFVAMNEAAKDFPGGYSSNGAMFKPGVTWYAWKFVKPGETTGMAFDGLTFVNQHWVWVPKPFRAMK